MRRLGPINVNPLLARRRRGTVDVWIRRAFFGGSWIIGSALICWGCAIGLQAMQGGAESPRFLIALGLGGACLIPAVVALGGLRLFTFPFSAIGAYHRTPCPVDVPRLVLHSPPIELRALTSMGFVSVWRLWPSGLSVDYGLFGAGFIASEDLRSIQRGPVGDYLWHDSQELRNPLLIPRGITMALGPILAKRDCRAETTRIGNGQ